MTSEIRANTIKNRVGLGTVSFTDTGPVVSGIATVAGNLVVAGNLTVTGTQTQDDVANVDSVGIITARAGIDVTGGTLKLPAVTGTNTNASLNVLFQTAAGVVDGGSQLTYNPGSDFLSVNGNFINLNTFRGAAALGRLTCANHSSTTTVDVSNTVDITTVDNTTDAFTLKQGSNEYITVDTTNSSELIKLGNSTTNPKIVLDNAVGIHTTTPAAPLEIQGDGGVNNAAIYFTRHGNPPNNGVIGQLLFRKGTDSVAIIQALKESANDDAYISMSTQPTGGNVTERLRIESGGDVDIKSGVLKLGSGANRRLMYRSGDNDVLLESDSGDFYRQNIANSSHSFFTGNNERLRIDSGGLMGLGTNSPSSYNNKAYNFVIASSGHAGMTIAGGTTSDSSIYFADGTSGAAQYAGWVQYEHDNNALTFGVNTSERLRITSTGLTRIESTNSRGAQDLLQLKHTYTSSTNDGPALLFNGAYASAEWAFAKICSVNSGSGYGADFQIHVHPADGTQGSSVVKALSILGDGTGANVTVTDGNLVIGTSGHGIDFSATSDGSGTTDSEILDDYEEGSFTATYSVASGSITTFSNRGEYVKIGRVVHFMFSCSANGSNNPSGQVTITGLPFTAEIPNASGPRGGGGVVFAGYHAPPELSTCQVTGTTINLRLNNNTYLQANTSGTGFGYNAYQISGFGSYMTTA